MANEFRYLFHGGYRQSTVRPWLLEFEVRRRRRPLRYLWYDVLEKLIGLRRFLFRRAYYQGRRRVEYRVFGYPLFARLYGT